MCNGYIWCLNFCAFDQNFHFELERNVQFLMQNIQVTIALLAKGNLPEITTNVFHKEKTNISTPYELYIDAVAFNYPEINDLIKKSLVTY